MEMVTVRPLDFATDLLRVLGSSDKLFNANGLIQANLFICVLIRGYRCEMSSFFSLSTEVT